jgi:hypothetical protein
MYKTTSVCIPIAAYIAFSADTPTRRRSSYDKYA